MTQKAASSQKQKRLYIRASEPEKALLAQAAQARHMNTSQFVLQTSLDAAQILLANQTNFRLSTEQWEDFCERLDAPPRAIPELQRLFREPDPFRE